jgi:hypothetical protein
MAKQASHGGVEMLARYREQEGAEILSDSVRLPVWSQTGGSGEEPKNAAVKDPPA